MVLQHLMIFKVATDAAFASIVYSGNIVGTSYALNGLSDATIYCWRLNLKCWLLKGFSATYEF